MKEVKLIIFLIKFLLNYENLDFFFDKKIYDFFNFNEFWKIQFVLIGDVCRLIDNRDNGYGRNKYQLKRFVILLVFMEVSQIFDQRDRSLECSIEERIVVEYKLMIKKSLIDCDFF